MENYSIYLPSYSIGNDVYRNISEICEPYGTKIIAIGGHKAMEAVKDLILDAIIDSNLEILDFRWYGGESSYETVTMLINDPLVQEADMIFAIGGGKATDTGKCVATKLNKPVFTFPTIASNCSACTSVSIMYHMDGSFLEPFFFPKPPAHAFIQTSVLIKSPKIYMWAGMGDTYAKYFESTVSSRNEELPHYVALGVSMSAMCLQPILQYGEKALHDNEQGILSYEYEQTVLSIIVSTAIVSILVTTEHIIDYNTGLAHAIFYALTSYPHIEERHLHGEIVSFGVLLLLLVDNQKEMFEQLYAFNKRVGLPTSLSDLEFTKNELSTIIHKTVQMKDIDHNPYKITEELLHEAVEVGEAH